MGSSVSFCSGEGMAEPGRIMLSQSMRYRNALSLNFGEFFIKFLDPDPDADNFQNLTSLHNSSIDTYHGKIFMKIRSVIFTWDY